MSKAFRVQGMETDRVDALLTEQIAYYRARANEYDRAYDPGDVRDLLTVTEQLPITGDTLELACGTGQWTHRLAARSRSVTALDASPEPLEIARTRVSSESVQFVEADVFRWRPTRRYDTVFFAFWLSHVPPSRFADFWTTVAAALAPQGRAIFIDEGPARAAHEPAGAAVRRIDDGREFRIVKVFHDPATLTSELTGLGWSTDIQPHGDFLVGIAHREGDRVDAFPART